MACKAQRRVVVGNRNVEKINEEFTVNPPTAPAPFFFVVPVPAVHDFVIFPLDCSTDMYFIPEDTKINCTRV